MTTFKYDGKNQAVQICDGNSNISHYQTYLIKNA
jgi:hypothetical protein